MTKPFVCLADYKAGEDPWPCLAATDPTTPGPRVCGVLAQKRAPCLHDLPTEVGEVRRAHARPLTVNLAATIAPTDSVAANHVPRRAAIASDSYTLGA